MAEINNPAGRLHQILINGKKLNNPSDIKSEWCKLLKVPNDDNELLYRRLSQVIALPNQTQTKILSLPRVDHNRYLTWVPQVNKIFGDIYLRSPWDNFINQFTPEIMLGIDHCSEMLSRELPEKNVVPEDLESLSSKIDDLIKEVRDSEIDNSLKEFALNHLLKIIHAIKEYQILGITVLEQEFRDVIGSLNINLHLFEEIQSTSWSKKFWEIFGRLAIIISISGAVSIGDGTTIVLPCQEDQEIKIQKNKAIEGPKNPEILDGPSMTT